MRQVQRSESRALRTWFLCTAWLGGSKSRTTAGLCNCLNIVRQVLWHPVGVHEVHYEAQFICDPGFDRQPVQLLECRHYPINQCQYRSNTSYAVRHLTEDSTVAITYPFYMHCKLYICFELSLQLDPRVNLERQCIAGAGMVQINIALYRDKSPPRLNIVDVLQPPGDLEDSNG